MQRQSRAYLWQILRNERERHGFRRALLWLSVVVIMIVFWNLKLTGITMAGEAFCGRDEHVHSEECHSRPLICELAESEEHLHGESCYGEAETCTLEEHIHNANCYSNIKADLETEEIWRASIGEMIPGASTKEKVMLIAQSQLGCSESTANFQVDAGGVRRGITRYGQWYGNPYGDWSSMFAAFCLHYAGVEDVTFNAGAESFRLGWEAAGNYLSAGEYAPRVGDLLFLGYGAVPIDLITTVPPAEAASEEMPTEETASEETTPEETIPEGTTPEETTPEETIPEETTPEETIPEETIPEETIPAELLSEAAPVPESYPADANGAATVAIITGVFDHEVTVVIGDVNGTVVEQTYSLDDPAILGYGLVPETSRYVMMMAAPPGMTTVAKTTNYTNNLFRTAGNRYVFYVQNGSNYYAFDGSGNAVPIQVDADGAIHVSGDPNRILWTTTRNGNTNDYYIQNVGTGRYLHPFRNSNTDYGITTPGRWVTTPTDRSGSVRFYHSAYIRYDTAANTFSMTTDQNQSVVFKVGVSQSCTVWLDGTCGGIMSLGGSDNTAVTAYTNASMTLPTEWKSPDKYNYVLNGWYDIVNNVYYKPGDTYIATGNAVLYADWKAASYDVGQFNSQVAEDSVSTNHFITTRMFDYGALMNLLSSNVTVSVSATSHSETWNLLTSGNNPYNGDPTLGFILRDWDKGNEDISYPNGHNNVNNPTDAGTVYPNLYTEEIRAAFFDPSVELPGKVYLGTADYLFQLCLDPSHDHYGYYYYNSEMNAASYNQSDGRFYVYDYLECTIDSYNAGNEGKYSDFLPFNSPYANTNGKTVVTYQYEGIENEYNGTTHYRYDSRYNDSGNSTTNVGSNFWYGMALDVEFYLPNKPGSQTNGVYGNQDIYGKDMHFRFTGDDDVWILIDGVLVLDLGGLHGCESGDINFATGQVSINGVVNQELSRNLQSLSAGDHVLSLYYMERGSSMSNCAIYFNLAPRFAFSIQKEDVLTRDVLNGAEFSVYTDRACTQPAQLWESKEAHDRGDAATNVFKVEDGVAHMWGMGASNTYYIRETKPPDKAGYGFANGIIRLTFDKLGTADYDVEILDPGDGISPGFIVHGLRVDTEDQQAYIIATNAPTWVQETTTVQAFKYWADGLTHEGESVTVYLTVPDGKGGVIRLQEATLSSANNWTYTWENLPKYQQDGVTEVPYDVEESYTPGYYSSVESFTGTVQISKETWTDVTSFQNGKVYILRDGSGKALATQRYAEDTGYQWISEEAAKTDPLALWTASVSGSNVRLTNGSGQTITFWYGNGSPTDFFALNQHVEDNNRKQYLTVKTRNGGITLNYNNRYIANNFNSSNKFNNTDRENQARVFYPSTRTSTQHSVTAVENGFLVTNTPLERETSVTVRKYWSIPGDMTASIYEQLQVPVRLYANGVDTGRTVTLSLRNGWEAVFRGLPYTDNEGNVISYTVKETWETTEWIPTYGTMTENGGVYVTAITNTYRVGGPMLPSTGSAARMIYILCGAALMAAALVCGIVARRKRERRSS